MDNPAPPTSERPPSGDPAEQPQGPRVTRDEVKDLGRWRRSVTDRHLGGVAGGLARHLDVDPIIVRVAFVVTSLLGGAGLLAYGVAWLLVPEDGSDDQPLGLDERSRTLALTVVGALAVLAAVGDWMDAYWFPWPIALVALGVLWFVNRNRTQAAPYSGTQPYDPAAPYAPPASYDPAAPYDPAPYDPTAPTAAGPVPPPGTPATYHPPQRPRNPRKRGPILFWFTLALIALAEGVLGVVHAAGADVVPSAYPALALGIVAAMLVLGAFWGRAGGLVLVGVVAAAATAVTATAASWDEQSVRFAPVDAGEVSDAYEIDKGELVLDLTGIDDVDGLDGREIRIDAGAGRVEVVVPEATDVSVLAEVGVGDVRVFQGRSDGLGVSQQGTVDGGIDAPDLEITIDLGVGEVVVRES